MSLILWYKLDGNLNDSSGNDLHGIQWGTLSYTTGKILQCGNFTGNGYIYLKTSLFSNNMNFSFSCWLNTTDIPSVNNGIMSFGWMPVMTIQTNGTVRVWWYNGSSYPGVSSTTYINDGIWHHILFIRQNENVWLYVDGNLELTLSTTISVIYSNLYIGVERNNGNKIFTGNIDDVRIYDHLLSTKEVKELLKLKVLHYKFDDFQEPTENLINPNGFVGSSYFDVEKLDEYTFKITLLEMPSSYGYYVLQTSSESTSANNPTTISIEVLECTNPYWKVGISGFGNITNGDGYIEGQKYIRTITHSVSWTHSISLGYASADFTANVLVGDYIIIRNAQIEKKDHATPFTESTRLGIVRDSTEYENDLELLLTTTPQWIEENILGGGAYLLKSGNLISTLTTDNINLQDYTYLFWFKLTSNYTGSFRRFLGRSATESDRSPGLWVYPSANTIHFQQKLVGGTNATPGDCLIDLNTWYFVAMLCKWDGTTTTLRRCVSGSFNQNTYSLLPIQISAPLIIGNYTDFEIDDLRIYGTFLSDDDILSIYNEKLILDSNGNLFLNEFFEYPVSDGLILWYKLDGNLNDSSGNNATLSTISGATYTTDGIINGAYTFASGNRIYSSAGKDFPATTSISAWGYPTSYSITSPMLFSFDSLSFRGPDLFFSLGTIAWNTGNSEANAFKNGGINVSQPSLNQWHYYVVVNDLILNSAILYIDGSYYGTALYRSTYQVNRGFTIGNYHPGNSGYAWQGKIDDVRIYNRLLTEDEILLLYNLGIGSIT